VPEPDKVTSSVPLKAADVRCWASAVIACKLFLWANMAIDMTAASIIQIMMIIFRLLKNFIYKPSAVFNITKDKKSL
jgi:hypothetical protein